MMAGMPEADAQGYQQGVQVVYKMHAARQHDLRSCSSVANSCLSECNSGLNSSGVLQ